MKYLILAFAASAFIVSCNQAPKENNLSDDSTLAVDMHNSQIALDWQGLYTGVLPCADCEGIRSTLILHDSTYILETTYIGEEVAPERVEGSFEWSEDGDIVILEGIENSSNKYKVGENKLFYLDLEGNMITGELEDHYVLDKVKDDALNIVWQLTDIDGQKIEGAPQKPLTFVLNTERAAAYGFAGCNGFGGDFEMDNENITLSRVFSTQMACDALPLEQNYLTALNKVDGYEVKGENLILKSSNEEVLQFVKTDLPLEEER